MKNQKKKDRTFLIASSLLLCASLAAEGMWKLIFIIPAYLLAGGKVIKDAAENLLHGRKPDECFLMSLATIGAFLIGEYSEAVFVMLFYRIGEYFEELASEKSKKSLQDLKNLIPETVMVERGAFRLSVSPADITKGDTVLVRAGERIPVDGTIAEGQAFLDTSALTGESLPRPAKPGDAVCGGMLSLDGALKITAEKACDASLISRIATLAEEAAQRKTKTERFIAKFAAVYTPIVISSAVLLCVFGIIFGQPAEFLRRALIFLVIACPCALVLSVPLTYLCGIGHCAQNGVLIKDAAVLDGLRRIRSIILDKTGTLTTGRFSIESVHPENGDSDRLLRYAALCEGASAHPLAISLAAAVPSPPGTVSDVHEFAGEGVSAIVDGKNVFAGSAALMERAGVLCPPFPTDGIAVHVAIGGIYAGYILFSDTLKPGAAEAIGNLKSAGISRIVMLTGDRKCTAEKVGNTVGISEIYASLSPADKLMYTEQIRTETDGCTAFIGDGINDTPAMALSDIGIAMGALGSDAAIEAADIVLCDDDPKKVAQVIRNAKKVGRILWENIIFSLLTKVVILLLGTFGHADLFLASFADVGVLILTVLNAIRALRK